MNVREKFSNLEKVVRTVRGQAPERRFSKPPTINQVIETFGSVIDASIRTTVNDSGTKVEMQRYIVKNGNKYGYLCFKSSNMGLSNCKSFTDLQHIYNALERSVKWAPNWTSMVEYVAEHCSAKSYANYISQLKVG